MWSRLICWVRWSCLKQVAKRENKTGSLCRDQRVDTLCWDYSKRISGSSLFLYFYRSLDSPTSHCIGSFWLKNCCKSDEGSVKLVNSFFAVKWLRRSYWFPLLSSLRHAQWAHLMSPGSKPGKLLIVFSNPIILWRVGRITVGLISGSRPSTSWARNALAASIGTRRNFSVLSSPTA